MKSGEDAEAIQPVSREEQDREGDHGEELREERRVVAVREGEVRERRHSVEEGRDDPRRAHPDPLQDPKAKRIGRDLHQTDASFNIVPMASGSSMKGASIA